MKEFRKYFSTLLQSMRHVTAWCVLCLLLAAGSAQAQTVFTVDGITYKTLTTSTVQLGDGTGAIATESTSCTIPVTVSYNGTNYTIRSIGYGAFSDCSSLNSVTFPASLTSIGDYAFHGCSGLTSVTFPASLTSIGGSAFSWCSNLTSVTLPASLTSIGNGAFWACSGLTSVTFPENASLTSIGSSVFSDCQGLTSVTFPASLTSIGDSAFFSCSRLTSVTLPASLTSIGDSAFCNCDGLTSVTFPASLTSIGNDAFYSCSQLTAFIVPSENLAFCAVEGVLFSKDKTRLVAYPIGKTGSSYTVPNGVTSIGDSAFRSCQGLTSVTFPASLTSIGDFAFYYCSKLSAFNVFSESSSFSAVEGVLFTKDKTRLVAYPIGKMGTSYVIPDNVTSIGKEAFCSCKGLTSVTFPASLTSIDVRAFRDCGGLASVVLPASLTGIGDQAFAWCPRISKIICLGAKEASIASGAFSSGPSSRTLYVPNALSGFTASKWGATSIKYGVGALCVTLAPEGAVTSGAQWSIDGGMNWNDSGTTLTGLVCEQKIVIYKPITGWTTPPDASVTVVAEQTVTVTGIYMNETPVSLSLMELE